MLAHSSFDHPVSVPIPSSFTSFFGSPPPREYTYDPSFIPSGPPRLNVKLPSFVRKRRNTITCHSQLKPILKKRKTVVDGVSNSDTASSIVSPNIRGNKGRAYTLASSAPVSAPSASSSISNIDPVYCPALAKIVSQSSDLGATQTPTGLMSSASTTSKMSTSPPKVDSSAAVGSPTHPLPPAPTELLPIRDCCRACRRAATYGEKCTDSTYHEHWSKAALEKRKRDEETKFERGEYITHDNLSGNNKGQSAGGDGSHSAGSDVAQVVETLEKEEAKHCHGLRVPLHSPRSSPDLTHSPLSSPKRMLSPSNSTSPAQLSSSEQGHHHTPPLPPLLTHVHNQIQAHQEAQHEKRAAHEAKLDEARQRIARLDLGKKPTQHEEEEDHDDEMPCPGSSASEVREQEGDDLELEGVENNDLRNTSSSEKNSRTVNEEEKNPICTLDGQFLRPCSSKSLYTGGPSIRPPVATTGATSHVRESDQSSNASSSDLSDDLVSNLSSLALSPASATTHASSWFGSNDLSSPPLPSPNTEAGKQDYFSRKDGTPQSDTQVQQEFAPLAKKGEGSGCSPLTRSKCLRPAGMYASLSVGQDAKTESCPTIREEDGPASSQPNLDSLGGKLYRANTATGATPSTRQEADDLAFAKALEEADKPVFVTPIRTQSLPAYSSGSGSFSPEEAEENKQDKPSWTSRLFHRTRGLSALGVAHGIVH